MSKVYRIHPGIGVARVGSSRDGYFLAGETPDAGPFDIDPNGLDAPFRGYKDTAKLMRRQGARFRVFEFDKDDASGRLTLSREITAADASIVWSVRLAAAKAAGRIMQSMSGPDGVRTIRPTSSFRNDPPPGFTRDDLQAKVQLSVTGLNAGPKAGAEPVGKIVGKELYIGEARTDASGRLVVLVGRGVSRTWTQPPSPLLEFLNNPGWHDDIADGTVDAVITFAGQAPIETIGAWVTAAPPDFAPDTAPLTTLYDIVEDVLNAPLPTPLTYPQDVEPMIGRAAALFFVNERPVWKAIRAHVVKDATRLADNGPAAAGFRKTVRDDLLKAESDMNSFRLTRRQKKILDQWVKGNFRSEADGARPALDAAAALDKAALDRCVGGGFFPGIEGGTVLRQPTIYSEFARLTRGSFTDQDGTSHPMEPGVVSARMACPWQADFVECEGNWWPAQRPDIVGRNGNGTSNGDWARGIVIGNNPEREESHLNMVHKFSQLGVVVALKIDNDVIYEETGRDPALDTGV